MGGMSSPSWSLSPNERCSLALVVCGVEALRTKSKGNVWGAFVELTIRHC
jgi:hypothetical protein